MRAGDNKVLEAAGITKRWLFGFVMIMTALLCGNAAQAHTRTHHHALAHLTSYTHHHHYRHLVGYTHHYGHIRGHDRLASYHYYHHYHHYIRLAAQYRHSGLQCVPYAREVSHIELSGNAFLWWAEASGRYARGNMPVEGAVLNFRAIRRMPLGHVAVVTAVIDNRTILVTQANWIRGTITNDVTMQDVSPNNDWTQVQVELGDTSTWGAAYPTYGFIYNQPATNTVIAGNDTAQGNEVAEAPRPVVIQTDAPDRNLQ